MDTELVFHKYYSCISTPISIKNPSRSNPSADFDSILAIDIRWPSGSSSIVCLPKGSSLGSLKNLTPCCFNLLTISSRSVTIKPTDTPIPGFTLESNIFIVGNFEVCLPVLIKKTTTIRSRNYSSEIVQSEMNLCSYVNRAMVNRNLSSNISNVGTKKSPSFWYAEIQ